jgi:2-oxoglutarate dehydrogenase E2 component (dihydrolipoamide succinyltransferase)
MPDLGEEIEKAVVTFWFVKVGDKVKSEDDIVELTTDKATFNVPAGASGKLSQILIHEGEEIKVGEILGIIE